MIVRALKSSVTDGLKIRPRDNAVLQALSDEIEKCYWAMTELQSCEVDCTTNLRHIYDRFPGHLQRKWRKTAISYRERSGGREPDLRERSKFITAQSLIENDPVYGRKGESQTEFSVGRSTNKGAPEERAGPTVPTLMETDSGIGWRWLKEYVAKWHRPRRNAQFEDLVLLVDQYLPRKWHLGRIARVIRGKDGRERTVEMKTGSSSSSLRPIQKLCLLEKEKNLYQV